MHPQTVRYRLSRLRDLFGDDLDDPAARRELSSRVCGGHARRLYAITYGCNERRRRAPANLSVGPRVRALRDAMGLSLRDLADRTGVSAPMLSQVERGETSPTLVVATRIAAGLELTLSQLLRLDESGAVSVVRASERLKGGTGRRATPTRWSRRRCPASAPRWPSTPLRRAPPPAARATRRCTSPAAARPPWCWRAPCGWSATAPAHDLEAGDAVTFDADLAHHFENPNDEDARFLAVVAAGLRRS